MAELRYLIKAEDVTRLADMKAVLGDPLQKHRTDFVKWLEHTGDVMYEQMIAAGASPDDALARVTEKLADITREWKAAAKAKATAKSHRGPVATH